MNFIYCNSNCEHQENGYCNLKDANFVSSEANDDCCFYVTKRISENPRFSIEGIKKPNKVE